MHIPLIIPFSIKGKIIVSGGFPPSEATEIYDISSNTWSTGNYVAAKNRAGSNVNVNLGKNLLLFIGGGDDSGLTDTILEYTSDTETWTARSEKLKRPVRRQSAVMIKNGLVTC